MKPSLKLALATFVLALALGSAPASALPSACSLRCSYPDTCYDACINDADEWITCFDYTDGACGL
jgi:hypothetical protein